MSTFLPFIVVGITPVRCTPGGDRLVLTYKTAGIFNFAYGSSRAVDLRVLLPARRARVAVAAGRADLLGSLPDRGC